MSTETRNRNYDTVGRVTDFQDTTIPDLDRVSTDVGIVDVTIRQPRVYNLRKFRKILIVSNELIFVTIDIMS